jgi:plastocyanin
VTKSASKPRSAKGLIKLAAVLVAGGLGWWALATAGCSGGGKPPKRTPTPIDAATTGSIQGVVLFKGTPPPPKPVASSGDAVCAKGGEQPDEYAVVLADKSGRQVVKNAFVWIKSGLPGGFIPAVPETPVVVDQKVCIFRPRVVGVQRYQVIKFTNSDQTEHNVKFSEPGRNPGHDVTMTGAGQELEFWFPEEAAPPMKVICSKHSWMRCFVGVCDHPWFAVTGSEGTFDLTGVPPGDYTIGCWTEAFGTQERKVKLEPKDAPRLEFSFEKKE